MRILNKIKLLRMFSNTSAYRSSYSREEYYHNAVFPHDINIFIDYENVLPAKRPVAFKDLDWGISTTEFIEEYGKPKFIISPERNVNGRTIFFYKGLADDHKYILQIHFIEDKYFYACNTFKDLSPKNRSIYKRVIEQKYAMENVGMSDAPAFADQNKNKVIISDSVHFNISYIAGDEKLVRLVHKGNCSIRQSEQLNSDKKNASLYSFL